MYLIAIKVLSANFECDWNRKNFGIKEKRVFFGLFSSNVWRGVLACTWLSVVFTKSCLEGLKASKKSSCVARLHFYPKHKYKVQIGILWENKKRVEVHARPAGVNSSSWARGLCTVMDDFTVCCTDYIILSANQESLYWFQWVRSGLDWPRVYRPIPLGFFCCSQ